MMLSNLVRGVLMYGSIAVAGLAIASLALSQRHAARLPDARIPSRKGELRTLLLRWLRPLAIALSIALFFWAYVHNIEYVIVTDGTAGPHAERRYAYEDSPTTRIAPGQSPVLKNREHDPVWVVNLSKHAIRVESVEYGRSFAYNSDAFEIPRNTAAHFRQIDYIGPHDKPPEQIRARTHLPIELREWLTWDEN